MQIIHVYDQVRTRDFTLFKEYLCHLPIDVQYEQISKQIDCV